jgi:hypothetical protein
MSYGQPWGFQVASGFSGLSAVSTGPEGTGATQATPATGYGDGMAQGQMAMGVTCGICQHPTTKQGMFIVAVILIAIAWHFHLYSMLE